MNDVTSHLRKSSANKYILIVRNVTNKIMKKKFDKTN